MKEKTKNLQKRIISLFIAMLLIFSIIPTNSIEAYAGGVSDKLSIVYSRYPSGGRWTNSFDGGIQCYGFAKMVIYNVFGKSGSSYRSWTYNGTATSGMTVIGSVTNYSSSNVQALLSKAKAGDVLQFNTPKQHSMIVYSVASDGVYIYDCNWDNNCGISKRKCSFGAWSGRNSTKLTLLRASNYSTVDGVVHTVNSNYSKNFTAYPKAKITASNIFDSSHNQYSSTAWIGTSDKCTINEVYTDGCCKVTYPISSGTVTAYSKISLFNTHSHNYTGARLYEQEHPHAISQRCVDYSNCGGFYWTGENAKINTCEKCWNIDFYCDASSIKIKAGETKTVTLYVDAQTACYPSGAKFKMDYDSSVVKVTNDGTQFTFTGLKSGSTTFTIGAYSDSTYSKQISSSLKIPIAIDTQTYTVSYNANGGTGAPSSQTKVYGQTLTLSNVKPSKTGYVFAGWSSSSTPTSAQYDAGSSYTSNSSIKLYAYWKPIEYRVIYFSNDLIESNGKYMVYSSSDYVKVAHTYDQSKALRTNSFSRTGYTFKNWNTEPDGSGKSYSDNQVVSNLVDSDGEDYKLYAQWTPITYTISYNANGGTGSPTSQTKKYGETIQLSSTKPTRSGYVFMGWSTSSTATTPSYSPSSSFSTNSNITLYAVWSKQHIHTFINKTTEPTCNKTGLSQTICSECGFISESHIIDKTNHTAVVDKAIAPTCSKSGLTQGSHCSVCNEVLVEQQELLAEHNWNEGIVSEIATCVTNGRKIVNCLNCGETKTIIIPAKGHSFAERIIVPTCDKLGYSEYLCVNCGYSYTDHYVTPNDHKYSNTYTIDKVATTSADGSKSKHCVNCSAKTSVTAIKKVSNIKLSATSYTYDAKTHKPTVTVKDSAGNTISSSNYTVSYASGRKYVGKYKVTVRFRGKYSGTKTLYFTIKPKSTSISSLKAGSKKFTVKWYKRTTQTTGYQVQYSTSRKFSSPKTVTIGKTGTTSKTISKLKAKKKYYVRVRTYKTVNGTKYYSSWSKAKYVTTKS